MIQVTNSKKDRIKTPYLNMITVGRAYELLRSDLQEHLRQLQKDVGFKYCRFHAVFHDDMAIAVNKTDGSIGYQWYQLDKIYDFLLSIGLKPFIELNSMPKALASGDQTCCFYKMNVTPPKNYSMWGDLIENFVCHLTERYGEEEVESWYFEVWNEPNLHAFWSGTMEDYFKLYQTAAVAIKKSNSKYRVGGPATASGAWVSELINYCCDNNVPIDFVSTHCYPQDEYCKYPNREGSPYEIGKYLETKFVEVYNEVKTSRMPDLEIHWSEWNVQSSTPYEPILWIGNKALDRAYSAPFIISNMLAVRNICDSVGYWTASDIFEESGQKQQTFSGTYGLVNIHGIKKAAGNAYMLLSKLRGNEIELINDSIPYGCGVNATVEKGCYRLLLWNCKYFEMDSQIDWTDQIILPTGNKKEYDVITIRIREGQGSPFETWVKMGKPHNLTRSQEELLNYASLPEYRYITASNNTIEFTVKPDEALYLEIKEKSEVSIENKSDFDIEKFNESLMTN